MPVESVDRQVRPVPVEDRRSVPAGTKHRCADDVGDRRPDSVGADDVCRADVKGLTGAVLHEDAVDGTAGVM
jgi:hypothetical protein